MHASNAASGTAEDFAALMEEAPGGENYGRTRRTFGTDQEGLTGSRTHVELGRASEVDFLLDGSWSVERGSAHRGVLHPDEYVDRDELLVAVERELGFTIDDVNSVYRQGRVTTEQAELRASIDARLLGLSRSGANMLALAKLFGWAITPGNENGGDDCRTMDRALARARSAEVSA